jgi:hypothetical protein
MTARSSVIGVSGERDATMDVGPYADAPVKGHHAWNRRFRITRAREARLRNVPPGTLG